MRARECHAAVGSKSGGARKRSCKAVKRSRRSIGPLHRGHSQVGWAWCSRLAVLSWMGSADNASSSRKQTGRSLDRLRVLRGPKCRMRTKLGGNTCSRKRRKNSLTCKLIRRFLLPCAESRQRKVTYAMCDYSLAALRTRLALRVKS
jgi:hypothetical protein